MVESVDKLKFCVSSWLKKPWLKTQWKKQVGQSHVVKTKFILPRQNSF